MAFSSYRTHPYAVQYVDMAVHINASLLIKYFILGVLIVLGLYLIADQNYHGFLMVIQAFLFTLVPTILKKMYGIRTPHILQAGIAVFMFGTIFLGETGGFYERFWWWDIIWHTLAGVVFGLIGYAVLILTYRKQEVHLAPIFTSIFAISFSLCLSTLWEIIEFVVDVALHTNMQPSPHDTMTDLVVALFGAFISAYSGYRYIQYRERKGLNTIIDEAVKKNSTATVL